MGVVHPVEGAGVGAAADGNERAMKNPRWYSFRWQTGALIGVIFLGVWYLLFGRFHHASGNGPAGPPLAPGAFVKPWSTNQFVLIGLGDSVTAGYGATPHHSYFELLQNNDDQLDPILKSCDLRHVLPNLTVRNYAVSYTVSAEHLRDQVPHVKRQPPHVRGIVVLTTGGNDLIHDYGRGLARDGALYGCRYDQAVVWKENFRMRLHSILDGVIAQFPGGCDIFLANIYDPTDAVGDIEHANLLLPAWPDGMKVLPLFNQVIAEACRRYPNVHLVDFYSEFLGHGIHCSNWLNPHYRKADPHYWYFDNLEDPNDRGYDAIRRLFLNEMAKIFGHP